MDNTWRSRMGQDLRQRHVDRIIHSLKEHLDAPPTSRVVRGDLRTLALHVEEEIFLAATEESDYARKINESMCAIETARAMARDTDSGMAEPTDIQESPGAVPIQPSSDGIPLQKAVSGEEEVVADFPNAPVTDSSSSCGSLTEAPHEINRTSKLTEVVQDFPNAIVIESSDGRKLIFLL